MNKFYASIEKNIEIDGKTVSDCNIGFLNDNGIIAISWFGNYGQIEYQSGNTEIIEDKEQIPFQNEIQYAFNEGIELKKIPLPNQEEILNIVRGQRARLLSEADIDIIRYVERGESVPQALLDYKQELRDIPNKLASGELPYPSITELEDDEDRSLIQLWEINYPFPEKPIL